MGHGRKFTRNIARNRGLKLGEDNTNSRAEKMSWRRMFTSCPLCPPHRGCNRKRKGRKHTVTKPKYKCKRKTIRQRFLFLNQ